MRVGEFRQQGDVIIAKVAKLPSKAKVLKPKARGLVLAEGEHTGHAHVIDPKEGRMYETNGKVFLEVTNPKGATLRHEEHNAQVIEPGLYEIGQVMECDPFEEELRKVQD